MTRLMAMMTVLGLFAVGVLTGGFSMHLFHGNDVSGPDRRGVHPARFIGRLQHELELSAEQYSRIEQILQNASAEAEALHEEFLPRVHEHMGRTRDKIRTVLTAEQQAKFDEVQRRHRRSAEQFLLGRGHRRYGRPPRRAPPPPPPAEN